MDANLSAVLIAYGVPIVVGIVTVLVRLGFGQLPKDKQSALLNAAHQAVTAVEQIYKSLPGDDQTKKKAALDMAQAILADLHVQVSDATLNALIEAAVHTLPPSSDQQQSPILAPDDAPPSLELGA